VILYGNYLNASEYLAETIDVATATVRLQPLQRYPDPSAGSGAVAVPAAMTDDEFRQLFPTSRCCGW